MSHSSGKLYVVATPIGNLQDISLRAIEILQSVSLIAAEDTRHSSRLLQSHGIHTRTEALHQHNERQRSHYFLERLQKGEDLALISDAGTPLMADPGQTLVQMAIAHDIQVIPIPGPCALIAALSASGLPTLPMIFFGFLPAKRKQRLEVLKGFLHEPHTVVFYEAPHRIMDCLADMQTSYQNNREIVAAKEISKIHESFYRGTIQNVHEKLSQSSALQQGEWVLLLKGVSDALTQDEVETKRVLTLLLEALPLRQAVDLAAQILNQPVNPLYRLALNMKNSNQ